MDFDVESNSEPQTSMSNAFYDYIPPEIVARIDSYLSFEDSFHFQISDDPFDCNIISTRGRMPKRNFLERNLHTVFTTCNRIVEVMMIVKDIGSLYRYNSGMPRLLKDTSLYQANGYLGYLFSKTPPQVVAQLKTVSLHVDIMRDNLRQLSFPCPTQDLLYSIHHLADSHFETFTQISFCSATIQPEDYHLRNMLLSGMEMTLKNIAKCCAKTDFTVDAAEGYADMTVEKGKMEYSFAFFYYNPHICGTESQSIAEGTDQIDQQVMISSPFNDQIFFGDSDGSDSNDNDESNNDNTLWFYQPGQSGQLSIGAILDNTINRSLLGLFSKNCLNWCQRPGSSLDSSDL
uniref:F-box domain-containing protein n=1 Tax=Setaria digitata TaxID=48799 RepID=A0A915Q307_9BILA